MRATALSARGFVTASSSSQQFGRPPLGLQMERPSGIMARVGEDAKRSEGWYCLWLGQKLWPEENYSTLVAPGRIFNQGAGYHSFQGNRHCTGKVTMNN